MTAARVPPSPGVPLIEFGERLGLAPESWSGRESATTVTLKEIDLPSAQVLALELADLEMLSAAYGAALEAQFVIGDLPVLDLRPGLTQSELDDLRRTARRTPSLQLTLTLDKSALAAQWLGPTPACRVRLYLFPAALEALLRGSLADLERAWWADAPGDRALVLVPARELRLVGPFLAMLGGPHVSEALSFVGDSGPGVDRPRAMYQVCRETVRWEKPWIEHLTPLHLAAFGDAADDDTIVRSLRAHVVNACLLFLADRTESSPTASDHVRHTGGEATVIGSAGTATADRLVATFSGVRQRVSVVVGAESVALLPVSTAPNISGLMRLIDWTYDPTWAGDRLPMVQLAFTETLLPVTIEGRLSHFIAAAPAVLDGLQWHWKAFIEGRIDGYEEQVRTLEDDVATVVNGFADQTAEMIKGLSDTVLATVAVVLGAFVASLLSDKFNAHVFQIAGCLYLSYVVLFPILFNMGHQFTRFSAVASTFAERLTRYGQQLPQERIDQIASEQFDAGKRRFRIWFRLTLVAYLTLVVILWIAVASAPRLATNLSPPAIPTRMTSTATPQP